jgi:4'-phosphopantetheinyl transferase
MIKLPANEIHTWIASVDDFDFAALYSQASAWLNPTEQARLRRFYFEQHKKQLLLGRILMRQALSHYEAPTPPQWQFCYNDYGKPALVDAQQHQLTAPLYFNLSHSCGSLVLAVARLEEVGVDVESNTRARRVEKIASRYFSKPEVLSLLDLDEPLWQARFYDLWSLKEAYIKACGMGLAIDLGHFSFSFPAPQEITIDFDDRRADDPKSWQFWQLDSISGFNVAIAAKSPAGEKAHTIKQFVLKSEAVTEVPVQVLRSSNA